MPFGQTPLEVNQSLLFKQQGGNWKTKEKIVEYFFQVY